MATTRLRSLSLSVALHGALLAGLLWLGVERVPEATHPAGITVVWLDAGPPDLAASSRGDAGIADAVEPDSAAERLPDPITAADEPDRPAPPLPDARDPVSGADRPAPAPAEPADENRQRRSEREAPQPAVAATPPTEALPQPSESPAVPPPSESPAPPDSADALPLAASDLPAEPLAGPTDSRPEPLAGPTDSWPEPLAGPAASDSGPEPPARRAESEASRVTALLPAREALEPVAPAEQDVLREKVMDLVNRSRELPSRASAAWSRDGREYRAQVTRVRPAGATGIEEAWIEVTTERDGRHVSTEMHVKRLAFSHYAQFIDRWDPDVQIHDDEIDGRFHSNTEIVVANSGSVKPVFHGKVTTASGIDTTRSARRVRRSEVFLGGLETRVPRIPLPRRFAPLETIAADALDVVALETDSRITFFADGGYAVSAMDGAGRREGVLGPSPTYFVAAEKRRVAVRGTVNGKVLVYSPAEIVIEGDLVYAADPSRGEDSDDYLGLVSDGSVEIAEADVTGPGDLTVHAAIYAKRRFAVRRYSRGERATLFVYGSVTAGALTATEPRYRTKLQFDPRLEHARPPSFPMTDRYELASWDGVWRAVAE